VAKVVATVVAKARFMQIPVDLVAWCLYAISTMKFVNLTPHDITVIKQTGDSTTFPKSGTIARVSQVTAVAYTVDGINVSTATFGPVVGLPDWTDDTLYIVSAMVKSAGELRAFSRSDLVSPGELVRDISGNVIGCKGFFC